MKSIWVCLVLAVALVGPAAAQKKARKAEAAVRQAEQDWAAASVKGDTGALERLLADDLAYTHSTARTETKAQFIDALKTGAMKYEAIDYADTVVRIYGKTAVVTSQPKVRTVSRSGPNAAHLRFLHVWVKRGGGWQMVAHQSTRIQQ